MPKFTVKIERTNVVRETTAMVVEAESVSEADRITREIAKRAGMNDLSWTVDATAIGKAVVVDVAERDGQCGFRTAA